MVLADEEKAAAMRTHRDNEDMFKIDEECGSDTGGRSPDSQPESSGKPGLDETPSAASGANEEIELSRRAVPVVELDDDVCSICLDEFTAEDPEQLTCCEHRYHLQCIMQWAQRSRECPMCFKTLQLQDAALNELLPFGEYVPPERMTASAPQFVMGLDAWELEQLLQRLAAVNGPGAASSRRNRRRHRAAAQTAQQQPTAPVASSARQSGKFYGSSSQAGDKQLLQRLAAVNGPSAASSRWDRRRHSAAAQQKPARPASGSSQQSGETNGGSHDSGHVKMNGRASNERASSSRGQGDSSSSSSMMPEEADLHPSSWPPPSQRNLMSHAQHGGERPTGALDGLQGLRSRLSGIKDSFSVFKGRWSGQHRSSQDHSRPPAPTTPGTPSVGHPQQRTPSS